MSEIVASKFTAPYPQPAMDGDLGLTSSDLAHALGVQHKNVLEKIRRVSEFLQAQGFDIVEAAVGTATGKQPVFVFDVDTAKYITATWRNELGVSYFRYLLTCERMFESKVPQLMATLTEAHQRVADLETKVDRLMAPKHRRIPGKGVVSVIVRTLHVVDMFGEIHDEIRREKKVYSELSPSEQRAYKIQHRSAVMKAIATLQDEDLNPKDRDTFH